VQRVGERCRGVAGVRAAVAARRAARSAPRRQARKESAARFSPPMPNAGNKVASYGRNFTAPMMAAALAERNGRLEVAHAATSP